MRDSTFVLHALDSLRVSDVKPLLGVVKGAAIAYVAAECVVGIIVISWIVFIFARLARGMK